MAMKIGIVKIIWSCSGLYIGNYTHPNAFNNLITFYDSVLKHMQKPVLDDLAFLFLKFKGFMLSVLCLIFYSSMFFLHLYTYIHIYLFFLLICLAVCSFIYLFIYLFTYFPCIFPSLYCFHLTCS